ncbi:MAG: phage tail protein [Deltaproteobacteria bacterium]|nr:phage tail protein [Deltaproteobacteria bacterium]
MANLDPWGSYYFALQLNGVEVGHFLECSGLKTTAAVYEIKEGGLNGQVHRLPGRSTWDNIVLKYGTSVSTTLLEWRDRWLQDKFSERPTTSGAIIMYGNDGVVLRTFYFVNAWPVSWEGPAMNADSSGLAVETLEIAHEGIYINGKPDAPKPPPEPPAPPEDPPNIVVDPDDDQIKTPPVQFEYDKADLTPEGSKIVHDVGQTLVNHPEITTVWVEGHTCTMGSWAHNIALSQARAKTVADALGAQVSNRVYFSEGYAYKYPVAGNSTEQGRVKNRRTEFHLSSPESRGRSTKAPPKKPS